jgi:citrate lyase beta subunit
MIKQKYSYGVLMSKGKQVKALPSPDLNQDISLELIAIAIKARRTQQGLDLKTASMLSDVSVVTLSKIEYASKGVRMESVLKVMRALGIKLSILPWESDNA